MTDMTISNVNKQMIQGLVDQFNAQGIETSGAVNSADKTVTLTFSNASGETRSIKLGLPDLDKPTVEGGAKEQLAQVADKLEKLVADLKTTAGCTAVSTSPSTLFNVYALIALLQEVAQKERQLASEVRQTEHQAVQAAMQMSANDIRSAGKISESCGLVMAICATATAGLSAVTSVASGIATVKANSNANLSGTKTDLKTAKADLSAAKKLNGETPLSNENADAIHNALEGNPELQAKFEAIRPGEEGKSSAMDAKIATAEKSLAGQEQIVTEKSGQFATTSNLAKEADASTPEGKNALKVRDTAAAELKVANEDVQQAKGTVKDLKMERSDDIMAVKKGLDDKIAAMPDGEEREALVQVRENFMAANKDPVVEGLSLKVDSCKNAYAEACDLSMKNGSAKWANGFKTCGEVCNQLGRAVDAWSGQSKSNAETEQQAVAKEDEARVEQERSLQDGSKDLFDSAKQMQQAVLEMRKAVEQMDAQLAQTIMRA